MRFWILVMSAWVSGLSVVPLTTTGYYRVLFVTTGFDRVAFIRPVNWGSRRCLSRAGNQSSLPLPWIS